MLRAEIASREVQINSMRMFATDQNPVAIRAQEEINSLRNQLARLEKDPRNPELTSTFGIPAGRVPAVALEYARKLREVKYHETLFELLAKQYEAARIDEAESGPHHPSRGSCRSSRQEVRPAQTLDSPWLRVHRILHGVPVSGNHSCSSSCRRRSGVCDEDRSYQKWIPFRPLSCMRDGSRPK